MIVYYLHRNSGIVQSVEQRTVNPYVAGSSPAARATDLQAATQGGFLLVLQYLPWFDNL